MIEIDFNSTQCAEFERVSKGQQNWVIVDVPKGHQPREAAKLNQVKLISTQTSTIMNVIGWGYPSMPGHNRVVLYLEAQACA